MVRWGVLLGLCATSIVLYPLLGQTNPNVDQNALLRQTQEAADAKSSGCLTCHQGIEPMHVSNAVKIGCTDCHGGDVTASVAAGVQSGLPIGFRHIWRITHQASYPCELPKFVGRRQRVTSS